MSPLRIYSIITGATVCFILLINLLIGIKHFNKFSDALKYLVYYLAVSFLAELLAFIYFIIGANNLWLINLYTVLEFVFVGLFINRLTQDSSKTGLNYFQVIMTFILVAFIGYFCFFKSFYEFSSYSETFENVVLMGVCIYYFVYSLGNQLYCKVEESRLTKWFVTAFFIYLAGTVLIWLAYEFILIGEQYRNFLELLLYFNAFLNLVFKAAVLIVLLSFDHGIRKKEILG